MKDGTEIYFVSNQTDKQQIVTPEFRVKNKQPELWDATNGNTRILPAFEFTQNSTAVPLKLAPYESAFIVFRSKVKTKPSTSGIEANYPAPQLITELNNNWTVTFDADFGGPASPVSFDELTDWTINDDHSIKYYSGTASYQNKFNLEAVGTDEEITIDLGNLTSMGKVYINGEYAGGAWTFPYRVNITLFVKEGENTIEVQVVNNWMNRIIGDMNLPENERTIWCLVNPYNKDSRLQPSGLFGPVKVERVKI